MNNLKLTFADAKTIDINHPSSSFFFGAGEAFFPEPALFDATSAFSHHSGFSQLLTSWRLNSSMQEGTSYPDAVDVFSTEFATSSFPSESRNKGSNNFGQRFFVAHAYDAPKCEYLIIKNAFFLYMMEKHDIDVSKYINAQGNLFRKNYGIPAKLPKKSHIRSTAKNILRASNLASHRLVKISQLSLKEFELFLALQELCIKEQYLHVGLLNRALIGLHIGFRALITFETQMRMDGFSNSLWIRKIDDQIIGVCATNSITRVYDEEIAQQKNIDHLCPLPFYVKFSSLSSKGN